MWIGIIINKRIEESSNTQVEATYYCEEMMKDLQNRVNATEGLQLGETVDLISYLETPSKSYETLCRNYKTDSYDYHVAIIDKSKWVSGDYLKSEQLETCYKMTTVGSDREIKETEQLLETLLDTQEIRLTFSQAKSPKPIKQYTLDYPQKTVVEGIEIWLEKEHTEDGELTLRIVSSKAPSEADYKKYQWMPLVVAIEKLGLDASQQDKIIHIVNETSFSIVVEQANTQGKVKIKYSEKTANKGMLTFAYKEDKVKKSYIVLCVVTKKGGTLLTDIVKKQIGIL